MEDIKVNVTSDNGVVEIRTGQALPLFMPKNQHFSGLLGSVKDYLNQTYQPLPEGERYPNAVILVDKKSDSIRFISDIHASCGVVELTGFLMKNKKVNLFGINTGKKFYKSEVQRLLRQNAMMFKDFNAVKRLITTLDELEITTEETIRDIQDKRGNIEQAFKRTVKDAKGLLPESIALYTELFEGFEKVDLNLEIEIDLEGKTPVYSFYCLELELVEEQHKEKAFSECISEQMINNFTIISVS